MKAKMSPLVLKDPGFTPTPGSLRTVPRHHDASKAGNSHPGSPFGNGSSCECIEGGLVRGDEERQLGREAVGEARKGREPIQEVPNGPCPEGIRPLEGYADPVAMDPMKRRVHRGWLLWRGGQDDPRKKQDRAWQKHGGERVQGSADRSASRVRASSLPGFISTALLRKSTARSMSSALRAIRPSFRKTSSPREGFSLTACS